MIRKTISILIFTIMSMSHLTAGNEEIIQLVEPQKTGGMPLFEALDNRQSMRSYSQEALSD